ncbi:MAG: nuclear transport factor 2 family protein [Xanthobacteraceae bacterium]|nr:nuclear transport factor 2 family protein [Xanthobacteraceae bacterium]
MSSDVTPEQLKAVGDAFARHDVDAIVGSFADDGVFRNAKGPDVSGRSYTGKAEIRAFFEALFANSPNIQWRHTAEYISGNRAVTEWHRSATTTGGERQEWLGCDLYTFRNGKIVLKDTYIKVVG